MNAQPELAPNAASYDETTDYLEQCSKMERLWVIHYVRLGDDPLERGVRAAEAAGSDNPAAYAKRMLRRDKTKHAVTQLMRDVDMPPEEIQALVSTMARASFEDFYDINDEGEPRLNLKKADARGMLRAIKKIKHHDNGQVSELELHDQLAAIKLRARMHGMLRDSTTNMNFDLGGLSDEQVARVAAGEDPLSVLAEGKR